MSEFRRDIGVQSRKELLTHKKCGGDATISIVTWKELIEKTEEPMKSIMGPMAAKQLDEKVRLIVCKKCKFQEVEPV